jgi:hypothetical protein
MSGVLGTPSRPPLASGLGLPEVGALGEMDGAATAELPALAGAGRSGSASRDLNRERRSSVPQPVVSASESIPAPTKLQCRFIISSSSEFLDAQSARILTLNHSIRVPFLTPTHSAPIDPLELIPRP